MAAKKPRNAEEAWMLNHVCIPKYGVPEWFRTEFEQSLREDTASKKMMEIADRHAQDMV